MGLSKKLTSMSRRPCDHLTLQVLSSGLLTACSASLGLEANWPY